MNKRASAAAALAVVAVLLFSAPAIAAEERRQDGITWFTANLKKGWDYYLKTVRGWFVGLGGLFTGRKAPPGGAEAPCEEQADCSQGLSCLNVCDSEGCDVLSKRCRPGRAEIRVIPEWSPCGPDEVCEKGAYCVRTCPKGVECAAGYRCRPKTSGGPACNAAAECLAYCRNQEFPPIGYAAFVPVCDGGSCDCALREAQPELDRVHCPAGIDSSMIACQVGASPGCTDDNGPVRLTCLTAPEYGGECLNDAACHGVSCPAGTSPFCDADSICRCRGVKQVTLKCRVDADCAAVGCAAGEKKVCAAGECACARTTVTEREVACATLDDCQDVICPSGYEKRCRDGKCACARAIQQ
jgi:hypothetical protein